MSADIQFARSLSLATESLSFATGMVAAPDPLHLNLPPMGGPGDTSIPNAEAMQWLSALYFQAELEQAGVLPVAEALAQERATMPVVSTEAAGKLQDFAQMMKEHWYDRSYRGQIFARVFGIGELATNDQGTLVNHDFERSLGTLCMAVARDAGFGSGDMEAEQVREAATQLLLNLGERQFGNALPAARVIQQELHRAVDLLSDPGIGSAFQTRGLWNTVLKILGPEAPDIGRHIRRAQGGQRVLLWLGSVQGQIGNTGVLFRIAAGDGVFSAAAQWLQATGLTAPGGGLLT